jgi:hypothetical protein
VQQRGEQLAMPRSGVKKSNPWLKWNLLLLLLVGALFGFIQLKFWWGLLQPKWQGFEFSWGTVRVEQLSLQLPVAGNQQLQLEQLELDWTGWPWPLDRLSATSLRAQLDLQFNSPSQGTAEDGTSLPTLPVWLPQIVELQRIELSLPCALLTAKLSGQSDNSQCVVSGALTYNEQEQQIQLQLANQNAVFVDGLGDLTFAIKAQLQPKAEQLAVSQFELSLQSSQLSWQQHQFSQLDAKLTGRALWQNNLLQLEATQPLQLTTAYQNAQTKLQKLELQAETLQLQLYPLQWQQSQLDSALTLKLSQLQHPQLKTLDWGWSGVVSYQQPHLSLDGLLSNSQSLSLQHQLELTAEKLTASWTLPELFFLAGNPLQLGPFWPELLTLQKGKASAKGTLEFDLGSMQLTKQQTDLKLRDISGIYDRTVFSGLSSDLKLFSQGTAWTVQTEDLKLQQINHGLVFGPLQLKAAYNTTAPDWLKGQLKLAQLELALFGGQVRASEQQIDLSKNAKVALQLDKLQLAELLKQHPSADMSGQGTISGTLPLSIERGKLTVAQGSVAALQPGGTISYKSDKAAAMAESNQGMKIVLQALQNFHFSVLSAGVSYSKEGQLLLALKLEGNNPDFEKGRAVNLTVNLEENLPAMITSLQLSGQVSELVKKRVQQRLATQKAQDARKE